MSSSAWKTSKKELLHPYFVFFVGAVTFAYIAFSIYVLNYRLITLTMFENASISYKATLIIDLFAGLWTAFTPLDTVLIIVDGVLVGANIALLVKTVRKIKKQGPLELSVGGATLLGLAAAGCGSCGLSVLALLGLSTSLSFLPFKGLELHILATVTLFVSFFYLLKKLHAEVYCTVERINQGE